MKTNKADVEKKLGLLRTAACQSAGAMLGVADALDENRSGTGRLLREEGEKLQIAIAGSYPQRSPAQEDEG